MDKGGEVFIDFKPSYTDADSSSFIHSNRAQKLKFPKEYPALIQVHLEHPAMDVPTHWHPAPELIYSRNRDLLITIDGKKELIKAGSVFLISSYALHSVHPAPSEIRQDVMSICFQSHYLERMLPQMRSCVVSQNGPKATDESRSKLTGYCEQLREHIEKQADFFETNQLLFTILHLIYSDFIAGTQEHEPKMIEARNRFMDVLDYLEKHYQQPLTTQSVAAHFGYTREYFCRLFRRYGNYTFKQYLTEVRLNAVVHDLYTSDQSVGQIAMDHGFPDEKSFFTAFKKKYGVTPVQYRRNKEGT